jgi:hypothetical protein
LYFGSVMIGFLAVVWGDSSHGTSYNQLALRQCATHDWLTQSGVRPTEVSQRS